MFATAYRCTGTLYVIMYVTMITVCARALRWRYPVHLLVDLLQRHVEADSLVCNAVVNACGRVGDWKRSFVIVDGLRRAHVLADVVTHTTTSVACNRGSSWATAVAIVGEVRRLRLQPNAWLLTTGSKALTRGGRWQQALAMSAAGDVVTDFISHNNWINVYGNAGCWRRAFVQMWKLRKSSARPDLISFNGLASACEHSGVVHKAVELLRRMPRQQVKPDAVTYAVAVGACTKAARWPLAVVLADAARSLGFRGGHDIPRALSRALDRGQQWSAALLQLEHMDPFWRGEMARWYVAPARACEKRGVAPTRACERRRQWRHAEWLLSDGFP